MDGGSKADVWVAAITAGVVVLALGLTALDQADDRRQSVACIQIGGTWSDGACTGGRP